jgi:hypothetical protein
VLIDRAAEMLEAGERRGRLLWEGRLFLALGDGVAVAVAFLLAFNLRSAEIRHEFLAALGWPMLVVLIAWYLSAEVADGYRLVNTLTPGRLYHRAFSVDAQFRGAARGILHRALWHYAADPAALGAPGSGAGAELEERAPESLRPRHLRRKLASDR